MKSLIVIFLFSLFSNNTVTNTESIAVAGCEYFEFLNSSYEDESCCYTYATVPGLVIDVTYFTEGKGPFGGNFSYPGPTIMADEKSGFFTVCIPLKFSSFSLYGSEVNATCTIENACFPSFTDSPN